MATSVVMPALEMAQEAGKLVTWHKHDGDAVAKGDLLMSIETDKAVVDIEADAAGVLAGVSAAEGDVVQVGHVIAWILAPGESVPQERPTHVSGRTQATTAAAESSSPAAAAAAAPAGAAPALLSPKARRLAAERGVDARAIVGSGPGGAVVAADLQKEVARQAGEEPGTAWRIMAERLSAAWTTVPHFFLTCDVDAAGLVEARARAVSAPGGAGVTYTDFLVAAAAQALAKHPRVNASWMDGRITVHDAVNVGIATAVEHGLVVPVVHGANTLTVTAIAARRRDMVDRARANRLQPADLAKGTFTISNLGMYAVDAFSAIVNAPQAAILAVGRIADRVVARDGAAVVRPMMTLTLSCDHRVVDGARGAAFLGDLAAAIEHPDAAS